jgi:hypothetical protein
MRLEGSLLNRIGEQATHKTPEVGMGATLLYYTLYVRKTWSERLLEVSNYVEYLGGRVYRINDVFASMRISCIPGIIPLLSKFAAIEFIEKD